MRTTPFPHPPPARRACTCAERRWQVRRVCPACQAWEAQRVLLVDGTTMARTTWVLAHATEEEV